MPKRALIIANSAFDDMHFGPLPAATADAAHLAEVLGDDAIGSFGVEALIDADMRTVMRGLEAFFKQAGSDDLLLLHLSLHGWKDHRGQLYFVVRDTERDYLGATAIPASFLSERMQLSRSRRIVLMLDCCYSGAFSVNMNRRAAAAPRVDVAEPFSGTGRVVLTASTALQYAHEGEQEVRTSRERAQPSVFTSAIVGGLRDGSADLDGDGLISVAELYEFVNAKVAQRLPEQTPTLSVDNVQGTIYLARNPRFAEGDQLAELRTAIASKQSWQRIGALHLIEQLLGSVWEPTRDATREALAGLITDADRQVAARAKQLWYARGLGEPPAKAGPPPRKKVHSGRTVAGIDFGTTNSAIGVLEAGDVRIVPNAEGALVTPSCVAITANGRTLVGAAAKRQAITNPDFTVTSVKLQLGSDWSIERTGIRYTAEDIASLILAQLWADAESYVGKPLHGAVLTVPANFSQAQRYALVEAARAADINVLRLLNEPTAAALTYGLHRANDERVLVVDLGGGTYDVSLLEIAEGVCEVKATAGDNALGGDDWDRAIMEHLVQQVKDVHGVDVGDGPETRQRLREAAEAAKIELSSATSTCIRLPYLTATAMGPVHVDTELARADFQAMTKAVLLRCRNPIERALKDAGDTLANIDHVILVGGATRMPAVGDLVKELTGGREPYRAIIPEGVATGATLQAGIMVGQVKDILLLDVISTSIGLETKGGIFTKLIDRNTTIPTKRSEVFTTARDNQTDLVVEVYEGEAELTSGNRLLLVLKLTDLSPAPRGVPQIEVTFDVDAHGILHVWAKDLTGDGSVMGTVSPRSITAAGAAAGAVAASPASTVSELDPGRFGQLDSEAVRFIDRIGRLPVAGLAAVYDDVAQRPDFQKARNRLRGASFSETTMIDEAVSAVLSPRAEELEVFRKGVYGNVFSLSVTAARAVLKRNEISRELYHLLMEPFTVAGLDVPAHPEQEAPSAAE